MVRFLMFLKLCSSMISRVFWHLFLYTNNRVCPAHEKKFSNIFTLATWSGSEYKLSKCNKATDMYYMLQFTCSWISVRRLEYQINLTQYLIDLQRWILYQNVAFCMLFNIGLPSLYWNMNSFRFIHQEPHSEVRHLEFQVNVTEYLIQLQRWVAYQNIAFCMLFNIGLPSLYWNMNSFRVIH